MNETVKFYTNKKSANILLMMGLIFSAICYAVTILWVANAQTFVPAWEFQILAAIVCTGVLITMLVAYKKKLKPREAIVVSAEGINDTMYELSYGMIKWQDVEEIQAKEGMVLITTNNQQEYMNRAKNPGMKRLLQNYMKKYNTPIAINTSYLTCSDQELAQALKEKQAAWKTTKV